MHKQRKKLVKEKEGVLKDFNVIQQDMINLDEELEACGGRKFENLFDRSRTS